MRQIRSPAAAEGALDTRDSMHSSKPVPLESVEAITCQLGVFLSVLPEVAVILVHLTMRTHDPLLIVSPDIHEMSQASIAFQSTNRVMPH
jgi:hypothetical protein